MIESNFSTPLRVEPWPSEKPLYICVILASLMIWFFLAVTIIGFFYVGIIGLVLFLGHVAMIAHVRGNSVRLGPNQFPELYASVEKMARAMGMQKIPEAYLMQQGGALNALATKFFKSEMIILYSDLLEACGQNTQARDMIIAHELAHLKEGHLRWHGLLLPGYMMPFLGTALSRAREYTCDRYGYTYAGRCREALMGLTILAAGAERGPKVNMQAMAHQVETMNTGLMSIGQWLSTHPTLSKRLIALDPSLSPTANYTQKGILSGLGILFGGYFLLSIFSFVVLGGYIFMLGLLGKAGQKSAFQPYSQGSYNTNESSQNSHQFDQNQDNKVFRGTLKDQTTFSLTAPEGWEERSGLNKVAELQLANISKGSVAIVIGEPKSSFANSNMIKSLGDYSEYTRGRLVDAFKTHQVKGPTALNLGSNAALQYEIYVVSENGSGANYLHTVVETPEHYYQILISTTESGFEKNLPMLKNMVESFEEKAPGF